MAKATTKKVVQAPYVCPKEREFGSMEARITTIENALNDNGHKGVISLVTDLRLSNESLSRTMGLLIDTMGEFKTSIEDFKVLKTTQMVEDQNAIDQKEKADRDKRALELKAQNSKQDRRWLIGIIITLVGLLFGTGIWNRYWEEKDKDNTAQIIQAIKADTSLYKQLKK